MTAAHEALNKAIDERRAAGRGLPCDGDARFISDSPDERREVAGICAEQCHLKQLCAAAGVREAHGIWGGRDMSTPSVTKKTRRKTP